MDAQLRFSVVNQHIVRTDEFRVVASSINYLYAHFDFTNDWVGTKTAQFAVTVNDEVIGRSMILDENGECLVPWEVLQYDNSRLEVSVFAGTRVTADKAIVLVHEDGYLGEEGHSEPTPDVYEQIIARLDDVEETVTEKAIEAKSWAVGDTGTRSAENTDNAKYYARQANTSFSSATEQANAAAASATVASTSADTATQKAEEATSSASSAAADAASISGAREYVMSAEQRIQAYDVNVDRNARSALSSSANASNSAASASDSAQEAAGYVDAVNSFAQEASQSASDAAEYSQNAYGYANSAETSKLEASRYEANARDYAQSASDSAEAAAREAESISDSVQRATQSATTATQKASEASASASAATSAKNAAEQAAATATGVVNTVTTARDEAVSASQAAASAKTDAEAAADSAWNAVEHYPLIRNDRWYIWDSTNEEYVDTGIVARGQDGDDGVSIVSVTKTGTYGLVDTYTISFSNNTATTYTVTNGANGDDYVLTNQDKNDIANIVVTEIGSADTMQF